MPVKRPKHNAPAKAEEQTSGKGGQKQYDNTNRGVLFLNDKEGNDARPDYQGFADIELPAGSKAGDVVNFRLAGWIKTPKAGGDDFLSLTVQIKQEGGGQKKLGKKS